MKKILCALIVSLPVILISLPMAAVASEPTTIYLIHHTEKDLSIKNDPPLTKIGRYRAQKWADVFSQTTLSAIYSTDTQRTRDTAQPTALAQALTVKLYDPFKIDHRALLRKHKGQTILVVGHSNTTPQFANALLRKERYQDIDETDHNRLYHVTIKGRHRSSQLLMINPLADDAIAD